MEIPNEAPATPPVWPTWVADVEAAPPEPNRSKGKWVALGVALVLGLGAVAAVIATRSSSSTESPAIILSRATSRTTGSGSAHFEVTSKVVADGQTITPLVVSGDDDFSHHASQISMATMGRQYFEIRGFPDMAYMSSQYVNLPGGKSWVSLSKSDVGADSQAQAQLAQTDPTQGLQFLSAIGGTPSVVGHEKMGDVSVTHYSFTIDLEAKLEEQAKLGKKLNAPGLSQGLSALAGSGSDLQHAPADAWIDGQGRVRKFEYRLALTVAGNTGTVTADVLFSNFDEAVSISAPPPSAVEPFEDVPDYFTRLAQGLAGSSP
jgi:hypothetical protein